jgi:hypothetical protein
MNPLDRQYEKLESAISKASIRWIRLEEMLRDLIITLSMYIHPAFEEREPMFVIGDITSNTGVRGLVASAKALAHRVDDPKDFYDRLEPLLNLIDNDYRAERNRFMHDEWIILPNTVNRYRRGSVVKRPQSHQRELTNRTKRQFESMTEIEGFADKLDDALSQLHHFDNELLRVLDRTRPHPE